MSIELTPNVTMESDVNDSSFNTNTSNNNNNTNNNNDDDNDNDNNDYEEHQQRNPAHNILREDEVEKEAIEATISKIIDDNIKPTTTSRSLFVETTKDANRCVADEHNHQADEDGDMRPDESSNTESTSSSTNDSLNDSTRTKKSVLFNTVTVYHFTRSQGFSSIPSQGGSTLGMKRRHFLRRKLSVDLFEEVRRRSRREILLKLKYDKTRPKRRKYDDCDQHQHQQHQQPQPQPQPAHHVSVSSTASSTASSSSSSASTSTSTSSSSSTASSTLTSSSSSSSASNVNTSSSSSSSTTTTSSSDSDDESFSDFSDISDSELENDNYIFVQPIGVKLRRSLLRASGVQRIDPSEKWDCKRIRDSRESSGCSCVNQCVPGLCECIILGVNCHVDRASYPCGCISEGCQNPQGRTEFDMKRVKGHLTDTLFKAGIG